MNFLKKIIDTKILFFTLFLSVYSVALKSQNNAIWNLPYEDMKRFHLGFHIGMHTQSLKIVNNGFVSPEGVRYFSDVPYFEPGFSVGVLGDMTIIKGLDLRISPTIHFGDITIKYTDGENEIDKIQNRSQLISIPLLIKYSSDRNNNIRPYISGGLFTSFYLGRNRNQTIKFNTMDYGLQFGLGIDIYMKYFKLCPEISLSYGLKNILDKNRKDLEGDNRIYYTNSINEINSRMIWFSLYFE